MGRKLEEKIKSLFPAFLYMRHKKRKEVRTGEPELDLLPSLLRGCKVAVDVGANRGLYSYFAARHAERVVAFEPVPYMREVARRFLGSTVSVHEIALSDRNGTGTINIPMSPKGRDKHILSSLETIVHPFDIRTEEVEVRTLDSFGLQDVGFIKIDVEGHELAVIAGARETIAASRPIIVAELFSEYYDDPRIPVDWVCSEFNYEPIVFFQWRLTHFDRFMSDFHGENEMASHGSTRNVIFLPK